LCLAWHNLPDFCPKYYVEGKITTQDGKPAEYVSIKVAGTAKGAIADSKGTYLINNLSEGTYKVEVSIVGLIAQSKKVTIQPNQDNLLDFILQENNQQLQEVIVIAERNNQFAQKETEYVSRLPLSNIQTPQSYSVVTANLLKEQLITDITASLKSITGGAPVQSNDGNASIYIRGFRSDAYIKDGLASYTRLGVDNANIERIEVIKGPSATLFGGTSANISAYGGVINRVSKKPTILKFYLIGRTYYSQLQSTRLGNHNQPYVREDNFLQNQCQT
jgi:iron complex outermembrane receptor protein